MSFLYEIQAPSLIHQKDKLEQASDLFLSSIRCHFGKNISYNTANHTLKAESALKTASVTKAIFTAIGLIFTPISLIIGVPLSLLSSSRKSFFSLFRQKVQPLQSVPAHAPAQAVRAPVIPKIDTAEQAYDRFKHLYPKSSIAAIPTITELTESFVKFARSLQLHDTTEFNLSDDEMRTLNLNFMRKFKDSSGKSIPSPHEFLTSMKQGGYKPKPFQSISATFLFKEGQPYQTGYSEIEALDLDNTPHWGYFLKKEKGKLFLFADGSSYGESLIINGTPHFMMAGRGQTTPYCELKEGDVITNNYRYVGVVDDLGNIITPSQERQPIARSIDAVMQIEEFHRSIYAPQTSVKGAVKSKYSNLTHVGIIEDRFSPGFSQISAISKSSKYYTDIDFIDQKDQELLVFDPLKDKTLMQLKDYFEEEFKFYKFSESEKIRRLYLFINAIFQSTATYQFNHHAYLIGDLMHSGQGVCRHRAFALKALCDVLDLPITYISGYINSVVASNLGAITFPDYSGHAWCVYEDQEMGQQYLVDPMQGHFIKKQYLEGSKDGTRRFRLKRTFGL